MSLKKEITWNERQKPSMKQLEQEALQAKATCLFSHDQYIERHRYHQYRCLVCGKKFKKFPNEIKRGRGCKCWRGTRPNRKPYQELFEEAYKVNLIPAFSYMDFLTVDHKMPYVCMTCENIRFIAPEKVRGGRKCANCSKENVARKLRKSYAQVVEDAKQINASVQFSEREYSNNLTRLPYKCNTCSHVWPARNSNVVKQRGCPQCAKGLYERICRSAFEQIFNKPFKSHRRLPWLKNKKGNFLELDGYNPQLNLAFEHNGSQHYSNRAHWGKLTSVKEHDKLKVKLCRLNKVKLIIIPELETFIKIADLKKFIGEQCTIQGVELPSNFDHIELDFKTAYIKQSPLPSYIELLKSMSISIEASSWLGAKHKYWHTCDICNYKWHVRPEQIMAKKTGCPDCAGTRKLTQPEIKASLAAVGLFLMSKYQNSKTKISVQCALGHRSMNRYNRLITSGCKFCQRNSRTKP